MGKLLLIAGRNLVKAGRRTLMMSVAVASVTALVVLMLSLTEGIRTSVVRSATVLLSGHVNVAGFFKPSPSSMDPLVLDAPDLEELVAEQTPGATHVVDRIQGFARVVSPTDTLQSLVMGIDVADETDFLDVIQLASPSEYRPAGSADLSDQVDGDPSRLAQPHTALLFASQAKRLGVGIGDPLTIRTQTFSGVANTADVTVVAIAEDVGLLSSFAVFVPKETLRELYQLNQSTTGMIMVYLEDPSDAPATMSHLRTVLTDHGYDLLDHREQPFFAKFEQVRGEDWTGQKLDLTTWKDQISFLDLILTAINTVSLFIIVVLGAIIAVGMINTMLMAVRERTSEIGTLRAIGMSRVQVLILFMTEAVLIGLGGATGGALIGAAVATGLDASQISIPVEAVQAILLSDTLHMSVAPTQALVAIASMTVFTALAALWPSLRAARMQPVDAIRHTE